MEKIKLVIWDLDETFWNGTLSEEGIQPIESNISLIKELCDRGIMNSIVSKNDFEQAKEKLIELGVWDYFVFPVIGWKPKGPAIVDIINRSQLRAPNVLFIDDNHGNLEEAKYYSKTLHVMEPSGISSILSHNAFKGKDDRIHSRLSQYKVLEKKFESSLSYDDNLNFLADSKIVIEKISGNDLFSYVDRIHELLERTNQLNFTKIRSSKEEILNLIEDDNFHTMLIKVSDKFGDYGVAGIVSLNLQKNELRHFTFSCRILNLGVDQFLYASLGFPKINIVPEVAVTLDNSHPDWISEVEKHSKPNIENKKDSELIFFKGGCDLGQMTFYLKNKGFRFVEETNYVSANNFPIHQEHSQVLLDSKLLSEENKLYFQSSDFIPFVDSQFYDSDFFSRKYSAVVYSVLMDYTNDLYIHKKTGSKLPFGGYYRRWTDEENDNEIIQTYQKMNIPITKKQLLDFRREFEFYGPISPLEFKSNLLKIREFVDDHTKLIFVNGAEVEPPNNIEKNALSRHKIMNAALDEFIENTKNTYLLDVRNIVTSSDQLSNNIRHYKREAYQNLSGDLLQLLNSILDINVNENIDYLSVLKSKVISNKVLRIIYRKIKKVGV
ncbi:HAD-IIIC family phosphatase [Nonlabens ulvanivorans]|uniref:HAD superfamily phosphatase (TIGR01681 family)/FkbH-like protein n=1 Tax=Nonlabens ulvanivorans TaxID=906888 RepID=A0ABX5E769_NONUL|nr:HAD-IIIC family phosphatase [Nonlabens ulvanivorans]PRX13760.1 HAD superfamily phosphatase (TIGR01681 family)/FkbH-like protein [Nonlabens ulvanivorans]